MALLRQRLADSQGAVVLLGPPQVAGDQALVAVFADQLRREGVAAVVVDELHRRVYETGTTVNAITSTPMPDGIIRQYEVVLNPLHDNAGTIIGIAGTTRDITERMRTEQEKAALEGAIRLAMQ